MAEPHLVATLQQRELQRQALAETRELRRHRLREAERVEAVCP